MAERYNKNPQSELKQLALTWNPSLGLGAVECSGFEGGAMIIKRCTTNWQAAADSWNLMFSNLQATGDLPACSLSASPYHLVQAFVQQPRGKEPKLHFLRCSVFFRGVAQFHVDLHRST